MVYHTKTDPGLLTRPRDMLTGSTTAGSASGKMA